MEGIPEADLRAHERRHAGKDADEPDTPDTTRTTAPMGMPPMPPLGMMAAPPMMPMAFTGIPFGMTPMSLPMMPVSMMTQLRPPLPMMPPNATNPSAQFQTNPLMTAGPPPPKPLFPSGVSDVRTVHSQ